MAEVAAETLEAIARNRDLVIAQFGPVSEIAGFGLNAESVGWIEGFIERQRERGPPGNLVSVLGSFIGEAIIAATGGRWDEQDGRLGVLFPCGDACFPFAKVAKQFDHGLGDSVLSFYDVAVQFVAKGKLSEGQG